MNDAVIGTEALCLDTCECIHMTIAINLHIDMAGDGGQVTKMFTYHISEWR